MKSVNKIAYLLAFTLLLAFNSNAFSQDKPQRGAGMQGNRMENMIKDLKEKLSLKADQETKIKDIVKKNFEAMRAEREKNQGEPGGMRETMMKMREKMNSEIESILNKKQKEAFKEYLKEQQNMRRQRGNN